MKTIRGFTLLELLVVIAIIGILLGVAIPNFRAMAANNRQMSASNELVSSLNTARNEAVTLARTVVITAKTNGGTQSWMNGWTITAPAQNGMMDFTGNLVALPALLTPLLVHEPLPSELSVALDVTGNPPPLALQFDKQGRLALYDTTPNGAPLGTLNTITICDDRTNEMGHQITLEPVGSVSTSTVTCN